MPTDFAPHDLTSAFSHSPYGLRVSGEYSVTYAGWKALDGGSGEWATPDANPAWLKLDLDYVTDATEKTPHDLTSATSHSPIVVDRSSAVNATYEAWRTLNGDTTHWAGTGNGVDWVSYDFGSGNDFILETYEIVATITNLDRMVKNWTLEGSADNANWDVLDTRTNQSAWFSLERRRFTCQDVSTAYRYFRINITANNGAATYTQIQEVYFYTTRTGTIPTKTCGSYAIKAPAQETNRAPKNWTLEGSQDGYSWDTLDTVTNETGWSLGETRTFTCDVATTAYAQFRLSIMANNGGAVTSVIEWYLYETAIPPPDEWTPSSHQKLPKPEPTGRDKPPREN